MLTKAWPVVDAFLLTGFTEARSPPRSDGWQTRRVQRRATCPCGARIVITYWKSRSRTARGDDHHGVCVAWRHPLTRASGMARDAAPREVGAR